MKLEEYRKNNSLTYDDLAAKIGLKRGVLYNICQERGEITLQNAMTIVQKTRGKVKYQDLISTPRG